MGTARNGAADLVQMCLHGPGIGLWHHHGRSLCAGRADRAEQIGVLITLVGGLTRPRSFASPLPNKTVLLSQARFILKPNLDRLACGNPAQVRCKRAREVFL
jgi:hypothetical protein